MGRGLSRSRTTGGSGAVTITPQLFVYTAFNNQIVNSYNTRFNPLGSFVDNPNSQYYGQAGVTPGTGNCPAGGAPCTDNVDYLKADGRSDPRIVRFAVKMAF